VEKHVIIILSTGQPGFVGDDSAFFKQEETFVKGVFRSAGFKLLVALIFAMFCLMLATSNTPNSLTASFFGSVATPMQRVSTIVTNNAAAVTGSGKSKEQLEAENEQLRAEVDSLRKKLVNYYTYQQENAQLRKFLELKSENPDFKPITAAVVGRDPNSLFGEFTIDQGTRSGVSLNDPVVTDAGVVGWISAVSNSYSKVTTFLSPNTQISAMDKATRETGVIGCDVKSADANVLKLRYLNGNTKVAAGDVIVTSGIGGVYPRNLVIGTVKSVKRSDVDVSLCAEVEPAVNVKEVRDVLVITSFAGQGEAMEAVHGSSAPSSSASSGGK
jgi:rod shape-determining protein MreC